MYKFFSILIFVVLALNSCIEDKKNPDTKVVGKDTTLSNNEVIAKSDSSINKKQKKELDLDKPRVIISKEKNLSKEELLELLPKQIDDFQTVTPTKGAIQEDENTVRTFAKGQYLNKSTNSTILIDINDWGRGDSQVLIDRYKKIPSEPGAEFEQLKEPAVNGYIKWMEDLKNGAVRIAINNRFEIIVRVEKSSKENLMKYLKMIDINRIKLIR